VFGGTPTIDGVSRIQAAFQLSDQRKFFVPCHHCGDSHVLDWDHVRWNTDQERQHEVFAHALPDTAYYVCPECGGLWSDGDKNRNVRKGEWKATAPFHGVAGFYINELYSPFPGSVMARLVEKYLVAEHALQQGDDTKARSFCNNTKGLPYSYKTDLPDIEALRDRGENYLELVAPWGVLVVTAGVDVQHDRLAISIIGWGRGEESWRLYWGEIHGQTSVAEQGAWIDLDALLSKPIEHVSGAKLSIKAVSIDSSDGQTSDAVYSFVRKRMGRNFMAVKGGSDQNSEREIFSSPQVAVDKDRHQKAHKYGLRPFIVGVQRAKDLLLGQDAGAGRLKLTGQGPGRMHWYKEIRPDWYEQITSEVKAPHRTVRNKKVWQKKAGVRNEALDTEVYGLHAARSLKINLWKEERWQVEEARIRQPDLLTEPVQTSAQEEKPRPEAPEEPKITPKPASSGFFNAQKSGFNSTRW
jgi:phage terminase large subunit GpA-like protein